MRRYRIAEQGIMPHFITSTVVRWLPIFTSEPYLKIITDSLQFCRENKGLLVHGYVVMPTHLHLIGSADDQHDLSGTMRDFRRHTSKAITAQLEADENRLFLYVLGKAAEAQGRADTKYKVWSDDLHPESLVSEKFFLQKLNYIHDNPVRKGLVTRPEHWCYSSARAWIEEVPEPIEIDLLG